MTAQAKIDFSMSNQDYHAQTSVSSSQLKAENIAIPPVCDRRYVEFKKIYAEFEENSKGKSIEKYSECLGACPVELRVIPF